MLHLHDGSPEAYHKAQHEAQREGTYMKYVECADDLFTFSAHFLSSPPPPPPHIPYWLCLIDVSG